MTERAFTDSETTSREEWTRARIEDDCIGCETLDDASWRPAEHCPVHGVEFESYFRQLNVELDRRWPGSQTTHGYQS